MTSREQDTDPSTPGALRGLAPTDPTPQPLPASAHVSTDPGLGPPSQPPMASAVPVHRTPPMGIVVPASAQVKPRKDSVELLLDGMQGPQPERPKIMPQTDGDASASYHAEHTVRPARTSPDDVPKVVVERPLQASTTRIDRAKVQAVIDAADARSRANEATAVLPQTIAPRVVVAIVAGVTVVLGLFVVLGLARGARERTAASSAAPPVTVVAGTATTAPPAVPAPVAAAAEPAGTSAEPATSSESAPTPSATATASHAPVPWWVNAPAPGGKPRVPRAAPTAGSGDIGEFKTNFH